MTYLPRLLRISLIASAVQHPMSDTRCLTRRSSAYLAYLAYLATNRFNRNELKTTETELVAMAKEASAGLKSIAKNG